jgi:exopolysaccharide production protein ExoQ
MSKASMHSFESSRARSSTPIFDKCVLVPISACVYTSIVAPLLIFITTGPPLHGSNVLSNLKSLMTPRLENKIFWPALATISVVLAVQNRSRLARLTLPPHIICFLAYFAFAGASVLWAFRPEVSLNRFVLQAMIVTSIVLPAMLAARTADMMRGMFLCFAFASILNVPFVLEQDPIVIDKRLLGYAGYFTFKGILGECAAIAFLLSLHEILYSGRRRAFGIIVIAIAIWLMLVSNSNGALGIALMAPLLAGLTLFIARKIRISPAIVLSPIALCYEVLSRIPGLNIVNRLSYMLYSNYTLSGRTVIWDFADYEIGRKPLFGWGYQSFWLVGPDAPSIVEAPGWVKTMPSAHNGYLDTQLEMGYIGLALLVIFIIATIHAVGRVADRDPARAWLLLSLALFIILTNMLETTWMRGMETLWLLFVIVAAETARYWQPFHPGLVSEPVLRGPVIAGRGPGLVRAGGTNRLARFQDRRT